MVFHSTGVTSAKNMANAACALRNALTACNTLESTKRFSRAVWISVRNDKRTSWTPNNRTFCIHNVLRNIVSNICDKIKWCLVSHWISWLWPSDSIWRHKSGTTLARVMACCLTASSHYLSQCWLLDNDVPWPSQHGNFIARTEATRSYDEVQNYISKIIATSPRIQWVKTHCNLVTPYGEKDLGQHWLR